MDRRIKVHFDMLNRYMGKEYFIKEDLPDWKIAYTSGTLLEHIP